MKNNIIFKIAALLLASFILLSYNDDPPNGSTGAPFDGNCGDCHNNYNPGNFNGVATIIGLPDTIQPNVTYSLQIKATVTGGNPVRAGFQLVVVDKNNVNAGNLMSTNTETDTEFLDGREYLDHRSGKYFSTSSVSWNFNWTAPNNAACNTIKFYYIVNFCNGSGDFGDFPITFADSIYFAGVPPLMSIAAAIQQNFCPEDQQGIAQAQVIGGASPYTYQWSNGFTGNTISALENGIYSVTVIDSQGCSQTDSTIISNQDTIVPQLICPMSFSVCGTDTVQYTLPVVSDNCDTEDIQTILMSGLPSNIIFPLGLTTQIFQATDFGGNSTTCSFNVQVNPLPIITLDSLIHDSGNAGIGRINVTVSGSSGGSFSYLWKKDGVVFATEVADINGLFTGSYSLEVTDNQGCSVVLANLIVGNTVSTHSTVQNTNLITLFPQPILKDYFFLKGGKTVPAALELINLYGQIVRSFPTSNWPGPFDIAGIPSGVYVLRIRYEYGAIYSISCLNFSL